MADNANRGVQRARVLALGLVLAGVLFASSQAVISQQAQPVGQKKENAHTLFTRANQYYVNGDYEGAAKICVELQSRLPELNATERKDLPAIIQKNNHALQLRRDAGIQLIKATELLHQTPPRLKEAEDLVKNAGANPYTDPKQLAMVNQQINEIRQHGTTVQQPMSSPKAMLAEGRNAFRRGLAYLNPPHPDFDQFQKEMEKAMNLAVQAKAAGFPKTIFPWQDNPDKLLKDVQRELEKPRYINPEGTPQKKPSIIDKLLHREPPPNSPDKNGGAPNVKDVKDVKAGNDGPVLVPVPGKDKTSKNTEPTSPYHTVSMTNAGEKNPPPNGSDGKPPIQVASNTSAPPPLSSRPPVDSKANNVKARQLIQNGYQALQAKDYESARRLAMQAKELHPDLEWFEQNPDRLLADIQKRDPSTGSAGPAITQVKNSEPAAAKPALTPAEKDEQARAKARELVQQGRELYKKNKLDDADKLCALAAGIQGAKWGLFEDSPERLRNDIQKARGRRDREEAGRLLTEARALFVKGNYQEAKAKAWQAQKLHGPYGIWDLGDRPQKLLAEIEQAESKQNQDNNTAKITGQPESKITPKDTNTQVAKAPDQGAKTEDRGAHGTWFPNPFHKTEPVKAPAESEAKAKARVLVAEARNLVKQGQLVPAREKAMAAMTLHVAFTAGEDSPAAVLQDMGPMCVAQMNAYLKRAGDWVTTNPGDPARFQKADADLAAARTLAVAFQLDGRAIDDKQAWIRQTASPGVANATQPVAYTPGSPNTPGSTPVVTASNQIGLDKLEKARMELRAGNTSIARRLAEDAFDPRNGVQREAAEVLRLIDAEEHNQVVLAAIKNMQTGMEAFQRRDYVQARAILAGVDPRLLDPERQRLLREVLSHPDMPPIQTMDAKQIASGLRQISSQGTQGPGTPGQAHVDDLARPGGEGGFESVRAMEDIIFQKLYAESREAQTQAMAQIRAGDPAKAIDTLKDYLDQLNRAQLEPEKLSLIRKQIEKRMQDYRTIQAQTTLAKASADLNKTGWNEGEYQKKILKTQDQVVELMDQYRALMKEGKYKDARLAALKAKELDPDNLSVIAALRVAAMKQALQDHEKNKDANEDRFLHALDDYQGPDVNPDHPLDFDKGRLATIDKVRKGMQNGIPFFNHNPIERDIELKLNRLIQGVNFSKTPLSNVIRDLQSLSGVNIVLDETALNEAGIGVEQPLTLSVENISLKSVLNLLLKQVNLTYMIKNEVLNITTEGAAKGGAKQIVYPVGDLVKPVEDHPIPDILDFQKLMENHMRNNGVTQTPLSTSVQAPFGLPGGQSISSPGNPGSPVSLGANNEYTRSSKTLEDQLIKLITNTIAPDTWESAGGPGKIQFFPLGMQLVIAQTQDVQEQVQELLAALRRLQDLEVAIELRLVSVSEAFFEKIGVNFSMNIPTHNSQSIQNQLLNGSFQPSGVINTPFPPSLRGLVTGLTPAQTFTPDLGVPIGSGSFAFSNPPFGGFPATSPGGGGIALGLAFLNDIQVNMFLEAAQGDRRTNIMQAPKITAFNGQTASINVNTTHFFLTSVNVSTSPFGQLFISPVQVPFPLGVFLTVTPVVSADRRFVRLNMTPSMTNLVDATVPLIPLQVPIPSTFFGPGTGTTTGQQESIFTLFFQQPSVSTITVNTTVNVPDGGTVLMGGLKTLSEGRNEFGPPILSKIPYISRLFKNVAYGREANSLMIMVTPRIIINEEEELIFRGIEQPIPRP